MICRPIDSLSELLKDYFRVRAIKPDSAEQYTIATNLFGRWYHELHGVPFHVPSWSEATMCDFLHDLRANGREPRTCNGKRSHLLTLWRHAHRRGLVDPPRLYDIVYFPVPERNPTAWTQEQLAAILRACDLYRPRRRTPGWDRRHDRAITLVMYDTAYRFSACMALRRSNLREDGAIMAEAETQKTLCDEVQWLAPDTMAAIRATFPPDRDLIFPWPFAKEAYWRRWKKILLLAKLSATRRDGPQKMRRTSVSWLEFVSPGSGKEHLGHKTAGLVDKHYKDKTIVVRQKAASLLPRFTQAQRKLF